MRELGRIGFTKLGKIVSLQTVGFRTGLNI